jgi:metal-dependent amidase/aminoacylase/carboxypeptidase family protein
VIINLRRHFHQYPEASLKEFETIKKIKQELEKLSITLCSLLVKQVCLQRLKEQVPEKRFF